VTNVKKNWIKQVGHWILIFWYIVIVNSPYITHRLIEPLNHSTIFLKSYWNNFKHEKKWLVWQYEFQLSCGNIKLLLRNYLDKQHFNWIFVWKKVFQWNFGLKVWELLLQQDWWQHTINKKTGWVGKYRRDTHDFQLEPTQLMMKKSTGWEKFQGVNVSQNISPSS